MYIRKICVLILIIFFSFSAECGRYPDYIRDRLYAKGFTETQISELEMYYNELNAPLTDREKAEVEKWVASREKRTGKKVTDEERKSIANTIKKQMRGLNYSDTIKAVEEAAKEVAKEGKKVEKRGSLSGIVKGLFSD